jgi:hypothetical protein
MKKRKPVVKRTKPALEYERRIPLGLEELLHGLEREREPFCGFFILTKEIAGDWFANHLNAEKQRTLSEDNITVLLRLQQEGLWTDYKPEVVFDTRWEVRNGQHRARQSNPVGYA